MAAHSSIFPAFITDEYQPGNGFAEFENAARGTGDRVRRQFEQAFSEIGGVIGKAVSSGLSSGRLDLNLPQFRQAAADAGLYSEALKATLRTATALARETQDTSAATRLYLQALSAQVGEAERADQAARTQVATYTRLQAALDATSASNSRLAQSYRDTFAEAAKAAQQEVLARNRQLAANTGYAPGLVRPSTDARASASVFQDAFAQHDAVARQIGTAFRQVAQATKLAADGEREITAEAERAWAAIEREAEAARSLASAVLDAGKAAQSAFAAGTAAADRFAGDLQAVKRIAQDALAVPRSNTSLDLGVTQYREAAEGARAFAVATREVAGALEQTAVAEGDTTERTRQYIQAARAAAVEAENSARAAEAQAGAMAKVQATLAQTSSATKAVIGNNSALANSFGTSRLAQLELVGVARSITDSYAAGIPMTRIFAFEIGRVAQAMTLMGGTSNGLTRFMQGPWAIAFVLAASVVGQLVSTLGEAEDKAKTLTLADNGLSDAQSSLGEMFDLATGKLKKQNDMIRLNVALVEAQLRLQAAQEEASARKVFAQTGSLSVGTKLKDLAGIAPGEVTIARHLAEEQAKLFDLIQKGPGKGGISLETAARIMPRMGDGGLAVSNTDFLKAIADRTSAAYKLQEADRIASSVLRGTLDRGLRREKKEGDGPDSDEVSIANARAHLAAQTDNLAKAEAGLRLIRAQAKSDLDDHKIDVPAYEARIAAAEKAVVAAKDGEKAAREAEKRARHQAAVDAQAERLQAYAQQAGSQIEGIEGRFLDQPKLAAQAAAALSHLGLIQEEVIRKDAELKKLGKGGIEGYAELMAKVGQAAENVKDGEIRLMAKDFDEASKPLQKAVEYLTEMDRLTVANAGNAQRLTAIAQARLTIETGLLRPLRDYLVGQERQAEIQSILNAGHEQEAAYLAARYALMDRLNARTEEELQNILKVGNFQGDINALLREQVDLTHRQAVAAEALREKLQPYLDALQSARDATRQLIEDTLGGKGPSSIGDYVKNLSSGFNKAVSAQLTEKLFGDSFRQLRDQVMGWDDPLKKATGAAAAEMDQTRAALAQLTQHAASAGPPLDTFSGTVTGATSALTDFTAALGGAGAAAGGGSGGGGSTAANVMATAQRYSGLSETGGKGALETLFSGAGINIDPEKTAWCAAFVNAVLGANGIKGTGSLAASSFLKYGTPTSNPQVGDIAVFAHHVGFLAGFKANGNPRILGGNQANGVVNTEGFPASEVLAYRHIPGLTAAVKALDPAAQAANDNLKALEAAVASLGETVGNTAQSLSHEMTRARGANDNYSGGEGENEGEPITVTGSRSALDKYTQDGQKAKAKSIADLYNDAGRRMAGAFGEALGGPVGKRIGEAIGGQLGTAMQGAQIGSTVAGFVFRGNKSANTGAQIGGALGAIGGQFLPIPFGKEIGAVVGSVLGGLVGKALSSPKQAGSSFAVDKYGNISVAAGRGDAQSSAAAVAEAKSVANSVQQIAKQLGGTLVSTALTGVTLGYRASDPKQPYRVDTTGAGRATGNGVLAFATQEEAEAKAVQLMIERGVIGGISAASQKILRSGQDLQAAIEKASLIEAVPKQLKALKDPVGAALDELNAKFTTLVSALNEGGATAEQLAQAEELYGLQRKQAIEEAGKQMTSAFKGLLDDLTINNDAFSLRDRLAAATAKFSPLEAQVKGGDYSHAQDFADAGKAVEAIMRQLYGSQDSYFAFVQNLIAETNTALSAQQGKVDAATGVASPFSGAAAPVDTTPAIDRVAGILSDTIAGQLQAVNDNLGGVINALSAGFGMRDFSPIVGQRNF